MRVIRLTIHEDRFDDLDSEEVVPLVLQMIADGVYLDPENIRSIHVGIVEDGAFAT